MIAAILSRILLNTKNMTRYFIQNYFLKDLHPIPQANKKRHRKGAFFIGREYRIRTYDILLPKQALYQAELTPENLCSYNNQLLQDVNDIFLARKARFYAR